MFGVARQADLEEQKKPKRDGSPQETRQVSARWLTESIAARQALHLAGSVMLLILNISCSTRPDCVAKTTTTEFPSLIVFQSPDTTLPNAPPGIFIIKSDGTAVKQLVCAPDTTPSGIPPAECKSPHRNPSWSPDGMRVAFDGSSGADEHHIFIMNADGSNRHAITPLGGVFSHPRWSPRGDKLYVAPGAIIDTTGAIIAAPLGGEALLLFRGDTVTTALSPDGWAPDGDNFIVHGIVGNFLNVSDQIHVRHHFYVLDPIHRELRSELTTAGIDSLTDFSSSPDGKRLLLVFEAGPLAGDQSILRLLVLPDSVPRTIAMGDQLNRPRWARDNRHFLCHYTGRPNNRGVTDRVLLGDIDASPATRTFDAVVAQAADILSYPPNTLTACGSASAAKVRDIPHHASNSR